MRLGLFLVFCVLASCAVPNDPFSGVPSQRITVDGSTFDIRIRNELAEAVRTNIEYAPRLGMIESRAYRAMARVSGCRVLSLSGDQAVMIGQLDCDSDGQVIIPAQPFSLECQQISDSYRLDGEPRYAEYDCIPF